MKKIDQSKAIFMMLLAFISSIASFSQTKEEKATEEQTIQKLVEDQHFVFVARMVNPTGLRSRQVTNDSYTLRISKDTIISDLPFFGRAYNAPIGNSTGGINFTSTQFEYEIKPARKSGWDIRIEPKDVSDIRQVSLNINTAGNTSVTVISNNRQSIGYTGVIEAKKRN